MTEELLLEISRSLRSSVESLAALCAAYQSRFDTELADIRDSLVDLDHAKAPTARLNELHTELDSLRDDFSVLRNDYRGEQTT